jgi:GTP-binding protein
MFNQSKLHTSIGAPNQFFDHEFAEIVMVGKSNVGKSSLINALINKKNLAYVGAAPGKTRLINFFEIDEAWMLVDVPGYGYAKMPKKEHERVERLMQAYFERTTQIKGLVILIDSRRDVGEHDEVMMELAKDLHVPFLLVFTKTDKITQGQLQKLKNKHSHWNVAFFSALKKTGLETVQNKIQQWLES